MYFVFECVLVFVAVLLYVMRPSVTTVPTWWGPLSRGRSVYFVFECVLVFVADVLMLCLGTHCDNSPNLVGSVEQGEFGEQLFIFFEAELVQCL